MSPRPYTKFETAMLERVLKVMSRANTWLYRASGGRFAGGFFGAPVLLLTTVGRKTGRRYTSPLLYLQDGERLIVVASKGGTAHNPLWYLNLVANPTVEVQIGTRVRPMMARAASAAERAELWPKVVGMYSSYESYQARTERRIPLVILTPR